jgi:hypothetical protein
MVRRKRTSTSAVPAAGRIFKSPRYDFIRQFRGTSR